MSKSSPTDTENFKIFKHKTLLDPSPNSTSKISNFKEHKYEERIITKQAQSLEILSQVRCQLSLI